jgi:threonine dehydratase
LGELEGRPTGQTATELVTLSEIREAGARLHGVALRTPLLPAEHDGERVWLKCESLQPTGAFKIRGAYNFIARLDPADRARGVITYSSGNHAQAVAYAARAFGVAATVVMPVDAPSLKVDSTRRFGAAVELCGTLSSEREARALELAAVSGSPIVPPFDHPDIIAGQGTTGVEIAEQLEAFAGPEAVPRVVVPIGGGGLLSGTSVALRDLLPDAKVVGVEPEGAASMLRSLEAGGPVVLESVDTIADGLRPVSPGTLTYRHCKALVNSVITVSDAEIRRAVRWCFDQRLVVEPSGAAGVAALLGGRLGVDSERETVIVISGGNIGPSRLQSLLAAADAETPPVSGG